VIIIGGVAMVFIVGAIIGYFFCMGDDDPVDETGRKLTRKQRGISENDTAEADITLEDSIDNI
jgi:hypothetical protein